MIKISLMVFILGQFSQISVAESNREKLNQIIAVTEAEIDQSLKELDSRSRKTRMNAEEKLKQLPVEMIPYLKRWLQNGKLSSAANNSVAMILKKINLRDIQKRKNPIQIQTAGAEKIGSILERLSKQTEYQIDCSSLSDKTLKRKVTFPVQLMTFWEVMNNLEKKSFIQVVIKKDSLKIKISEYKKSQKRILTDDGLFRISLKSAQVVPLVEDQKNLKLRIRFEVISEPGIFPFLLNFKTKEMKVVTQEGVSIAPLSPESQLEISPAEGSKMIRFHVDYLIPESVKKKFTSLRLNGSAQVVVSTHQEKFQLGLNESRNEWNQHLLTLKFNEIEKELLIKGSEAFRITVQADYDLDRDKYRMLFESHRRWIFKNKPFLIDKKTGKIIQPLESFSKMKQDSNVLLYQIEFRNIQQDEKQYQLQFPAFTTFEIIPIQFDYENVIPDLTRLVPD